MTGHRADGPMLGVRAAGDVTIGGVPVWIVLVLVVVVVSAALLQGEDW